MKSNTTTITDNQPVTQKQFRSLRRHMNTRFKEMENEIELQFTGVNSQLSLLAYRVDTIETRLQQLEEKLDSRFDTMMTNLDWLVGAFKKFDEEHTVFAHRLQDHDIRLEKLEAHTV